MADGSFGAATATIEEVGNIIQARLADSQEFAAAASERANTAIDALTHYSAPAAGDLPHLDKLDIVIKSDLKIDKPSATSFGAVTGPEFTTLPQAPNVSGIVDITIPDFTSSIGSLSIPAAPGDIDLSGLPSHPSVDFTVTLPDSPSSALPNMDALVPVSVPDFIFPTLPAFDATAPQFQGTAITSVLQWREPVYAVEVLDEVLVQVRRFLAGGSGLPVAVEEAIFARGMDREDHILEQAVKEVYDEMALRGYTMPPGVLNARVDEVRQKATLAKQGAAREITIKAAEWEIANLKFAVEQGVACENVLVNIFLNQAERQFLAAKYEIESKIAIYNAQVALYNASQQAYATAAQVFKIRVDAELSKLEVFKAQIQGEIAKGQFNEQTVRVFQARIQAVQAAVDIYKSQVEAVKVRSEAARTQIEAYKVDVEAYSARVTADKTRFEAYAERVKAEAAKAGIIDAEARAYAALVQGKSAQADIRIKQVTLPLEVYKTQLAGYTALIDADKTRMQYQLQSVQASVSAYDADTKRFVAQAQAETAKAELNIKAYETGERLALAFYEAQIKAYDVASTKAIEQAKINIQGLSAAGQISSTMAAGALAALHVGAQLTGAGSVAANAQDSNTNQTSNITQTTTSEQHSVQEIHNFEGN